MTRIRRKMSFVNILWEFEEGEKGKMEFGLIKNVIREIHVMSRRFNRTKNKIIFQTSIHAVHD